MLSDREIVRPRPGEIYRDLDGSLVQLLRIVDDVCCWIPIGTTANERQYTHVSHFVRRFRMIAKAA